MELKHFTLCLIPWYLDLLLIISHNSGVLTLPIAQNPLAPPHESSIFMDILQENRTQVPRTKSNQSTEGTHSELGSPDLTVKTNAQHNVYAKPDDTVVDLTKSFRENSDKKFVSSLINTNKNSGISINKQSATLFKAKNDATKIPEIGRSENIIAQVLLEKLHKELPNQSKHSESLVQANDLDLQTVHSSKKRAVNLNDWQRGNNVQLAVHDELGSDQDRGGIKTHETLTAVMALVVLCSLGMVGGVFGCCCPKQKPSPEPLVEETKDATVANDNGVKNNQEIPLVNTSASLQADVDLDDGVSVKEKAKALDNILLLQPSPNNRRSQLSPDSPGKRLSRVSRSSPDPDRADDRKSKSLDIRLDSDMTNSMIDSITNTPDDITDNLSMYSSTISQSNNPDVVIADSDEDDQFAEIQRGTKILKSFQRAKPPKNRSPATRTPKGKIRRQRQTQPEDRKSESVADQEPISQSSIDKLGTSSSKNSSLERSDREPIQSASKTNSLDKSTGSLDVLDATSESPLLKSSDFSDLESDNNCMTASVTSIGSDIVTPTKRKGKHHKHKDRKIISADVVMNKNRDINDERSEVSKRYEPKVESPLAKRKNGERKKSNGVETTQKRSSRVVTEDNDQNPSNSNSNVKRLSGVPAKASNNIFYLIDPTVKDKCKSVGDVTKSDDKKKDNSDAKKLKLDEAESSEKMEPISPIKRERTFSDPRK